MLGVAHQAPVLETASMWCNRAAFVEPTPRPAACYLQIRHAPVEVTSAAALDASAGCASGYAHLVTACNPSAVWVASAAAAAPQGTASSNKESTGAMHTTISPVGVDPVFIRSSPLFSKAVASRPQDWYNTSSNVSHELNPAGYPWGFFPTLLKGRPAGHAVVVSVGIPEPRIPAVFNYLKFGRYLDRTSTAHLQAMVSKGLLWCGGHTPYCFQHAAVINHNLMNSRGPPTEADLQSVLGCLMPRRWLRSTGISMCTAFGQQASLGETVAPSQGCSARRQHLSPLPGPCWAAVVMAVCGRRAGGKLLPNRWVGGWWVIPG